MTQAQMQMPPGTTSPVPEAQHETPNANSAVLQQAETAIAAGKHADAVALLKPLATPAQKDERVFYDLGFAQDALGNDSEAVSAYRAAIERNRADAAARVSFGLLLARDRQTAAAEEQLLAAVALPDAPAGLRVRADRALAELEAGSEPEKARGHLLEALKLSPETPDDMLLAGEVAESLKDYASAEKAYARAYAANPANSTAALEYARVLGREKKHAEAEFVLDEAHRRHPENRDLAAELASEDLLNGKAEQATSLLESMHAANPKDEAVARLLAAAYVNNGMPEKANPLYASLLAAAPYDVSLQVEWADSLIRQKRAAEAEPILQTVVNKPGAILTMSEQANALGMLAFAASSNRHPEAVLQALATREKLIPSDAPYTFLAATAHDTLHHARQAEDAYRLFLQQAGDRFPDQKWQAQQRLRILARSR